MAAKLALARFARRLADALDGGGRMGGKPPAGRDVEEALETERQRLRLVVQATQAGIVDWDIRAQRIWWSGRMKRLLGYPPQADTSGWRSIFDFIHPQDRERVRAAFVAELKGNGDGGGLALHAPMEFRLQSASGASVWVQSMALTQRDAGGRATRYLAALVDISARRAQEERLRDQIALTEAIVAQTPNAIFVKDPQGRFTLANRGWSEMSGIAAEQASGRTVHELYPPEVAERFAREDEALIAQGAAAPTIESVHEGPRPGQYRIVRKAVLRKDDGTVLGLVCSSTDISELKRVEAELRDQMMITRALFDENPVAMYLKDPDGRYVTVNDAWLAMAGLARDAVVGRSVLELFPDEEARRYHAQDLELLARGEGASEVQWQRTAPDGSPQWVIVRKAVLRRPDGGVAGLIGSISDVTHLKRIEAELRDQVELTRALIDENPNAMYLKDAAGRYVTVNDAWVRMLGMPRERAIGRTMLEVFPSEPSRDASHAADLHLLAQGSGASESEVRRTGPDGRPQWLIVRKAILHGADGSVRGLIGTNTDITRLKQYEAELATEQRRLDLVVRAAKVGIVDWDGATRSAFYSQRLREIRGYAADADTAGWPDYFELIHPEDRARVLGAFQDHIRGRGPQGPQEFHPPIEYRLSRADGSHVWVQGMGVSVRDAQGRASRFIAAIADITGRRAQEEALRQSVRLREEVERMSRHDLKTPLNSVIAISRLLREGARLSPEDEELLSIVERAGYRILNMVNLSLDLFRMEQGTYQFRAQTVDLAETADRVAADLYSQAESKGVAVRVRRQGSAGTPEGALLARGDELLCYSMLANVVKNAIEAAPMKSAVTIAFERAAGAVLVHVHNAGAVPPALRERFFEKYITSGKSGGLGIGTYSARLMARVQQGDMMLRTSEAEGTTVSARLASAPTEASPRRADPAAPAAPQALPPLPALSVLVVDDDEFNRLVLRRYLPSPPLRVAAAVNGLAALEAAGREWPDVVFLDLEMPVMDGYEAARRLRELQRTQGRKRCTIVAFSSNDEPAIIRRAREAGCDQYVVKPAPRQVLWRILTGADAGVRDEGHEPPASATDPVLVEPDLRGALPAFLESRRRMLDDIPAALGAGDRVLFRRLAHRLAGSFALYGFKWAAAQCEALEDDAALGEAQDLQARAAAVREHLERVEVVYGSARGSAGA